MLPHFHTAKTGVCLRIVGQPEPGGGMSNATCCESGMRRLRLARLDVNRHMRARKMPGQRASQAFDRVAARLRADFLCSADVDRANDGRPSPSNTIFENVRAMVSAEY